MQSAVGIFAERKEEERERETDEVYCLPSLFLAEEALQKVGKRGSYNPNVFLEV